MELSEFLVEYEDALHLMKMGYNHPVFVHYTKQGDELVVNISHKLIEDNSEEYLRVPTFEQAFAYIALEHKLEGVPHGMDDGTWSYDLNDYPYSGHFYPTTKPDFYETAKEAKTACLRDLFKLIENR